MLNLTEGNILLLDLVCTFVCVSRLVGLLMVSVYTFVSCHVGLRPHLSWITQTPLLSPNEEDGEVQF